MKTIETKSAGTKEMIIKFHVEGAGITEKEALDRWDGLEKFLKLCVDNPGTQQIASEPVDQLWHDFLQFTESYAEYCMTNFGKMVHHLPAPNFVVPSGYFDTRALLTKTYGELLITAWPLMERAKWSVGYTTE